MINKKISNSKFNKYIDNLIVEKGFDLEHNFEITSTEKKVFHLIPLQSVVDFLRSNYLSGEEKFTLYHNLTILDFKNINCFILFGKVAQYIADENDKVIEGA